MMVYVCGKFGVCSMFLSDFTKGTESNTQHYGALKSPARIELIWYRERSKWVAQYKQKTLPCTKMGMYLFARKHLLSILSSEPLGGVPWNRSSQSLNKLLKGTLMQIWKSAYVIVFMRKQFRILNPKNSGVIDPWNLFYFLKIRRLFASFYCLYCWLWTYFSLLSSVSIVTYENVKAHWITCFVLELLRYLLPEEVYKPFHTLDQKHHFELFPNVRVPEKQRNSLKNTCEWVHNLAKFQAQGLTLNYFTSIFQGFF